VVAAVLDLHKGAGAAFETVDQMAGGFTHRHDVGHLYPFRRGGGVCQLRPCVALAFLAVADDPIDLVHRGKHCRFDLGGAAGDHDGRLWPFALETADGLPGLSCGLGCDGTGVENHQILMPGFQRLLAHGF
jgi:hypothetical protein